MIVRTSPLLPALLAACFALPAALPAQRVYSAHDYAQAERWMIYNVNPLIDHTVSEVKYLSDGRIFYRDPVAGSVAFRIADVHTGKVELAFDTPKLAAALSKASGREISARYLRIDSYTPEPHGFAVTLRTETFHCAANAETCTLEPPPVQHPEQKPNAQPPAGVSATQTGGNAQMTSKAKKPNTRDLRPVGRSKAPFDVSPDKKLAAFIRDNNLWVRVEATGEERQLTTDGVKDFGYATDNAGWTHSDAPILIWSPDSKKIATFQQDQRKDGMMYLVSVTNRHPTLDAWRYPLLGDKDITKIERVVIDVDTGKMVRLKMPPDEHRSTLCDDVSCRGGSGWDDVKFSSDGKTLAFVSTSRDHKDEWFRVADTETGDVRTIYHEHVPTYYESGQGKVNWFYLPASNEFLWYSERSNWGQMYLYDLATGQLKNQITHGDGPVTQVLHVDEKNRVLYFLATGKEKGQDPYFTHFYRVNFDGTDQRLLTPEDADHAVTPSPDGSTFVDVYSTRETPETVVLRDNSGKVIATLAHQNISRLLAAGWKPPQPITVNARDGKTPLYGFLWKPTDFDAGKKYPIVDYVYPGPQIGSCGSRSFSPASGDDQSLADLGFIVVCIDGMGTPFRSKSFHDEHADIPAEMGEATIPDQVAGIKQLAARFPWIDIDRVGIWGHSGGGNATASALFHYPDFFKVGWAESGNHDNRDYEDDWDEKYAGLEVIGPNGEDNYEAQANQNYAGNLKGHLMLVYGTMDDNVPPNNTLMVVLALMNANKNFDMLAIPNAHHGYGQQTMYIMRRRWDYFVRYLAGGIPPVNYQPRSYEDVIRAMYGPDAAE
ncbi:MAG TPA: DPP IV N-terminal domain-containing protein [Acidobacteriaceae bacterium]|jgi:dipeptidyl aminopeptidase/acylaminoacyl peptidase|nr:DPP IV N-terminal domain-containing protein [Acidobacteriaceae bacterium]